MPDDRIPPNLESYGYRVIGWVKEAITEGDEFLRGQDGYSKCDESIRAIMGINTELRSSSLSSTECTVYGASFSFRAMEDPITM